MTYLERYPVTEKQASLLFALGGNCKLNLSDTIRMAGFRHKYSGYVAIRALIKKGLIGQRPELRGMQGSYYRTLLGKQWVKDHKEEYRGRIYSQLRWREKQARHRAHGRLSARRASAAGAGD